MLRFFLYLTLCMLSLWHLRLSCETNQYVGKSGVGIIKIVVTDKRQKLTWQTYSSGLLITYFTLNLKVAIKSYFCMHLIFHILNFRVNKKIHNIYADLNRIARSRFIHYRVSFDLMIRHQFFLSTFTWQRIIEDGYK